MGLDSLHLAQLQSNKNNPDEVTIFWCWVHHILSFYKMSLQTESTTWIYKLNIDFEISRFLEQYFMYFLNSYVPHFWQNWKKSTRFMCSLVNCGRCYALWPPVPTNWVQDLIITLFLFPIDLAFLLHGRWSLKISSSSWVSPHIIVHYASMTL